MKSHVATLPAPAQGRQPFSLPTRLRRGGAAEIVRPDTGVLFDEQTPEAILAAVEQFESQHFDAEACRANALRFDRPRFRERFRAYLGRQSAMVQGNGVRTATTSK